MIVDPDAANKREMAQRANNVQAAMQLMSALAAGGTKLGPVELAEYCLTSVEQLTKYMERPFEEKSPIIQ